MNHGNISLHYFVTAAEELNITRAAEKLYITQQALSEHIKKLERQYDIMLFQRGPKLKLTYQGEQFLAYAKRVIEAESNFIEAMRSPGATKTIRLPIGLASARSLVFIPNLIIKYSKLHPEILLSIISGNRDFMETQLRLGRIELYLGMMDSAKIYGSSEILYRDQLYFIISTDLLEQYFGSDARLFITEHKDGIRLEDTRRIPVALPTLQSSLRTTLDKMFSDCGIIPNCVLETVDHSILFDVCQSGLCCAFVSRELLYRKLSHKSFPPNMIFLPLLDIEKLNFYGLVTDNPSPSSYVSDFITCCKDTVNEMMGGIDFYLEELNLNYINN